MIVLAGGCFDLLHVGHLWYLEEAKKHGEILYVAVTADAFVNKGPGRPVFPEQERLQMVKALNVVHGAFLTEGPIQALMAIRPDVYVKGAEYEGNLPEQEFCRNNGIKVVFTKTKTYSSTKLLNHGFERSQKL